MADVYTCRVCGMKISLNVLTQHILMHDQYSAFTYNETTKIVEPLDDCQNQNEEKQVVASSAQPKSAKSYLPSSNTFVPLVSYNSTPIPEVLHLDTLATDNHEVGSQFEGCEKPSINQMKAHYSIAQNLQGKVAESPLEHLTGIQMIASVAESLDKREKVNNDNNSAAGWIDENGRINIDKPPGIGDVIGTIKLPVILSGMEGISCECSIVFNRYVNEGQTIVEETNEVPGYEDLNLDDIINNSEEEAFNEDLIDPNLPVVKRQKVESGVKGRKTKRRMEVYKYKEAGDTLSVQNELQNNIVPELLKDPAVVKYLETLTGKTIQPMVKVELSNEVEDIVTEANDDAGLETYAGNCLKKGIIEETINAVKDDAAAVSKGIANNLNGVEDCSLEGVEEGQVLKKFKTITVKWAHKVNDPGGMKFQNIAESLKDISALPASKNCLDKPKVFEKEIMEGSENDDSEQEMMDIERNFQETNSNTDNMEDSISKKELSLFGFKVEQFVEDVTKEVKEKFCDTTSNGEVICNSKDSANNELEEVYTPENTHSLNDKISIFYCTVCKKSFHSLDNLENHQLTHKKDSRQTSESFTVNQKHSCHESKNISANMTTSANKTACEKSNEKFQFYCMKCNKVLPSQKHLQEHSKSHQKNESSSDNIQLLKLDGTSASDDTLTAESDVDYINSNDIKNEPKEYEVLNKCLNPSNTRIIYEIVPTRKKRERRPKMPKKKTIRNDYICENCGAGFSDVQDCNSHMEQCKDSRILKCFQGCGSRFKSKSLLDVHKKFCSRRLAYIERINNDLVKTENPGLYGDGEIEDLDDKEEKKFKCMFCEEMYQTEKKRLHHQLVCPLRPKQKCSHCNFECKGDKSMAKHLVEEHGLKPFQCQYCSRSFRLKNSLNDHVRSIHTKETFTCEYCGKSFIKQSLYRSHVSIQHQGFRLECCYCSKKFKDRKTWKMHETSHKGVYVFACDVCKKTFNRSDHYKDHMQSVHSIDGETALSLNSTVRKLREELCSNICGICSEKFPLKSAYVVHMMKVHKVEVPDTPEQVNPADNEQVNCPTQNVEVPDTYEQIPAETEQVSCPIQNE